jgi:uncharacterized spore protein YtfJ
MFSEHGFGGVDVVNDQENYQAWEVVDNTATTINFDLQVLGKRAANTEIVGYYKTGEVTTLTDILTQVGDTDGEAVVSITIPVASTTSFGFAVKSADQTWYSEKALNSDSIDHLAVYNPLSNTYLLAFEDLLNSGDSDYNDMVLKISNVNCGTSTSTSTPEDEEEGGGSGNGGPSGSSTTPVLDEDDDNGGSSGTRTNRNGRVAGDSISNTASPEPLVLGEQVSMVPEGAPGTGQGGTSSEPMFGILFALLSGLAFILTRRTVQL